MENVQLIVYTDYEREQTHSSTLGYQLEEFKNITYLFRHEKKSPTDGQWGRLSTS